MLQDSARGALASAQLQTVAVPSRAGLSGQAWAFTAPQRSGANSAPTEDAARVGQVWFARTDAAALQVMVLGPAPWNGELSAFFDQIERKP